MESQQWFTAAEVAAMLRIDRGTVYRLVESRQLPGVKIGKSVRIRADVLKAQLDKLLRPAA